MMDYKEAKSFLEREVLLMHTDVYDNQGRYITTEWYNIRGCGLPFQPEHKREIMSIADAVAGFEFMANYLPVGEMTLIRKIIVNGERHE